MPALCGRLDRPVPVPVPPPVPLLLQKLTDHPCCFGAPAAPAPKATRVILIIASIVLIFELEVKKPTAHVNITRDITLGFISK